MALATASSLFCTTMQTVKQKYSIYSVNASVGAKFDHGEIRKKPFRTWLAATHEFKPDQCN
jgi:hypothetical protein